MKYHHIKGFLLYLIVSFGSPKPVYNSNKVVYGSPNCVLFCIVGCKPPNVENHCFKGLEPKDLLSNPNQDKKPHLKWENSERCSVARHFLILFVYFCRRLYFCLFLKTLENIWRNFHHVSNEVLLNCAKQGTINIFLF